MQNHLIVTIGILVCLTACNEPGNEPAIAAQRHDTIMAGPADPIVKQKYEPDDLRELSIYMQQFKHNAQQFTVGTDSNSIVRGEKGTRLRVVPADLEFTDGTAVNGSIVVRLTELQTAVDFLQNAAPTMAGGRLLESGGAYHIGMSCRGKELRIKRGRSVAVSFPKISSKDMALFYGQKDSLGIIDWKPAKATFQQKVEMDSITVRVPIPKYKDTILTEMEVQPGQKAKLIDYNKFRQCDRLGLKLIDGKYYLAARKSDTADQKYEMKKIADLQSEQRFAYEVMNLTQMGWINCDRFMTEQTTPMLVELPASSQHNAVQAYVVFKDINSAMMKVLRYGDNVAARPLEGLPVNRQAKLIAVAWKAGKPYAYTRSLNIQPNMKVTLDLKPVSKDEVVRMISM